MMSQHLIDHVVRSKSQRYTDEGHELIVGELKVGSAAGDDVLAISDGYSISVVHLTEQTVEWLSDELARLKQKARDDG